MYYVTHNRFINDVCKADRVTSSFFLKPLWDNFTSTSSVFSWARLLGCCCNNTVFVYFCIERLARSTRILSHSYFMNLKNVNTVANNKLQMRVWNVAKMMEFFYNRSHLLQFTSDHRILWLLVCSKKVRIILYIIEYKCRRFFIRSAH